MGCSAVLLLLHLPSFAQVSCGFCTALADGKHRCKAHPNQRLGGPELHRQHLRCHRNCARSNWLYRATRKRTSERERDDTDDGTADTRDGRALPPHRSPEGLAGSSLSLSLVIKCWVAECAVPYPHILPVEHAFCWRGVKGSPPRHLPRRCRRLWVRATLLELQDHAAL